MATVTFSIEGTLCNGCAERIRILQGEELAVRESCLSFADGSAEFRHNPRTVSEARRRQLIETGAFTVVERSA